MRSLIGYDEDFYEHTNRIDLRLGVTATKIRPDRRILELKSQGHPRTELQYDNLILTTGASPTTLAVPGSELNGVFTIRTMNDVEGLANYLGEAKARKAAIIGAGLIGSEMAEALLVRGVAVLQAEIVPEILPVILDPDMAAVVREKGEEHGVEYHLQSTLEEILGDKGRVSGIRIDERMLTSASDVYAAGDCIETFDLITRRHMFFQLATTAVRQSMVAGINAAGGEARYPGSTGATTEKLFGLEVATLGPTTATGEKIGITPTSVRITGSTRLTYYPGGKDLTVKLLANPANGKLLGAQLVGEEGATLRANFASMAAHLGLTVQEFAEIETCYSPPLAPVWDPVTIAAQALVKKLKPLSAQTPSATVSGR